MKILTWNTAMKFREKIEYILPFSPDLMVIPECEAPEKWSKSEYRKNIEQFLWLGDNPNKGIGIISSNSEYKLELHPAYNREFQYIIPIKVSGKSEFILFAIWTKNMKPQYYSYVGQIYLAFQHYKYLLDQPCMLVGDWNSNKIFDHIKRIGTHTNVVEFLQDYNIYSVYHKFFKEEQGLESIPTHYFRKDREKPFHLDYVFASNTFLNRLMHFEIGKYEEWIKLSDHMPLVAEFVY